jgi:tetratricopeptide (TPR) repeat protein
MLEIPQRIWKKVEGYTKPQKVFRTNHENVLCWKTLRKSDKKPVVIKLFEWEIVEHCADELRAAEVLKKIEHKNLVRVLDVVEDEEIGIYYVMECWGDDLRETIKVKPDIKITLEIIRQVLEGLAELHKHKLTHRDIKPENIFLKGAQVKIGDYGLVKSQRFITQLTTIAGTRDYMAPEVFSGNYDHRCDIYSTGVVLRELLTGEQPPFKNDRPTDIKNTLWNIVIQATDSKPEKRYQNTNDFINEISNILSNFDKLDWQEVMSDYERVTKKELSVSFVVKKEPIFQKLVIQRYPPKPELRGQDDSGVLVKTLQARLDEILRSAQNDKKEPDYNAMLPIATELRKAVVTKFDIYNSRSADALDKEAEIHLKLGNYPKSIELFKESLDITQKLYGLPSKEMIASLYNLAEAELKNTNYPASKEWYNLALRQSDKIFKGLPQNAIVINNLAGVHYLLKEYQPALNLYQGALAINEKHDRFSEPIMINLYNMALTYEAMDNKGTAEPLYKQASETLAKVPTDKLTLSEKDRQQIISGDNSGDTRLH